MRRNLAVVGFLVFIIATTLALYLIFCGKLSGAEFVAFVVSFAVLGLVVGFAPEVQEVSIVGNVVKLKEIKSDALKAIESLNSSRIEMLRVFLSLVLNHGGTWGSCGPMDPRIDNFLLLYWQAKNYQCLGELKLELSKCLKVFMANQLRYISSKSMSSEISAFEPFMAPSDVLLFAFDVSKIGADSDGCTSGHDDRKKDIIVAFETYSKLYKSYLELESLR